MKGALDRALFTPTTRSPTSRLLHLTVYHGEVSRGESVDAVISCMMRSTYQHLDDGGGLKSERVDSCRWGSLVPLSDRAEWCDSLCHVAKTMSCRLILGIKRDRHGLGNLLM